MQVPARGSTANRLKFGNVVPVAQYLAARGAAIAPNLITFAFACLLDIVCKHCLSHDLFMITSLRFHSFHSRNVPLKLNDLLY